MPTATAHADDERPAAGDRLLHRIERLAIVDSVREVPRLSPRRGLRFFRIKVELPVDHARPEGRTFRLRVTLVHAGLDRPTVVSTGGYGLWSWRGAYLGPVTTVVGGNQLELEHRFFAPSRPKNPDWAEQLTIRQAAADQHRIIRAFQRIYRKPWLSTGASKGGMATTYHRRFYPGDVAGSVPLVAPNDVVEDEDAYGDFLATVGGPGRAACRDRLIDIQRRILGADRGYFEDSLRALLRDNDLTVGMAGGLGQLLEITTIDFYFSFWQYAGRAGCREVPEAGATRRRLWRFVDQMLGWTAYTDQAVRRYVPYYFQAATQLGSPAPWEEPLADLLEHPGLDVGSTFVPDSLQPVTFDAAAMADIDSWVRSSARRMIFVYGEDDPWGAERFACGPSGAGRECRVYEQPGGTHGANIYSLPAAQRTAVIRKLRRWAGLATSRSALAAVERRLAVGAAREDGFRERLRGLPSGDQPRPQPQVPQG